MSESRWRELLLEPQGLTDDLAHERWFDEIAKRLLCGTRLMIGSEPHRYTEIEFYYHGAPHLDVFTHRDPIQKGTGLWYFHRTAGVYRGGSFKGHDLAFGGPGAFGGVLIRGIEQEDGPLIDGPSLCVDHLLARTEAVTVAELDAAINGRPAWDPDSPVHLVWLDEVRRLPIVKSPRVGLSLKKLKKAEAPTRFIMRHYRYLSEPRRISKGKQQMVLALNAEGKSPEEIRELTGCTKGALARYVTDQAEGAKETSFDAYFGIDLGPKELARLHGQCHAARLKKASEPGTRRPGELF
jgi:3-methyladenine DNA glycosylase Mpg